MRKISDMKTWTRTEPVSVELAGQTIELLASGAAFWRDGKTLFVADLHLGKTTTFRRGGIPLPSGITNVTVSRLIDVIQAVSPTRLIVLGDLIHARCSWDDELTQNLTRLCECKSHLEVCLVEGNHDRGSRIKLSSFPIQIVQAPYQLSPFTLLHDESTERPAFNEPDKIYLAGHTHPCVQLGAAAGESMRLKCFQMANCCLTLPAFGEFTGAMSISRRKGDDIFAIAGNEVIRISTDN